jgi:hypothetical protein
MNIKTSIGFVAAGLIGLGVIVAQPAGAQAVTATPGFVGNAPSSVPGCPFISWRLANENGSIHGFAEYSNLSGISTVTGMMDSDGKFTLDLRSVIGDGPVGTVTGTRMSDGSIDATLVGQGCANNTVHIAAVSNMNSMALVNRTGGGR